MSIAYLARQFANSLARAQLHVYFVNRLTQGKAASLFVVIGWLCFEETTIQAAFIQHLPYFRGVHPITCHAAASTLAQLGNHMLHRSKSMRLCADRTADVGSLTVALEGFMKARGSRDIAALLEESYTSCTYSCFCGLCQCISQLDMTLNSACCFILTYHEHHTQEIDKEHQWKSARRVALLAKYSDLAYPLIERAHNKIHVPTNSHQSKMQSSSNNLFCLNILARIWRPSQAKNTVVSHSFLVTALLGCHSTRACLFAKDTQMEAIQLSAIIRRHLSKYRECGQVSQGQCSDEGQGVS